MWQAQNQITAWQPRVLTNSQPTSLRQEAQVSFLFESNIASRYRPTPSGALLQRQHGNRIKDPVGMQTAANLAASRIANLIRSRQRAVAPAFSESATASRPLQASLHWARILSDDQRKSDNWQDLRLSADWHQAIVATPWTPVVHVNLQKLCQCIAAAGKDESRSGTRLERTRRVRELQNLNCPFLKCCFIFNFSLSPSI